MKNMNIPVGVSDFAEIRQNGYYYVDKSTLIKELLKTTATKVTLITRPRRFGKTLAMSMLANFFDICRESHSMFKDLEITKEEAAPRTAPTERRTSGRGGCPHPPPYASGNTLPTAYSFSRRSAR